MDNRVTSQGEVPGRYVVRTSSLLEVISFHQFVLTHWLLCRPSRPVTNLGLSSKFLTSSVLTKIGIIYSQLLQKEKTLPMMPRSEWSASWSLRYAQKCSKSWVKKSEQNVLPLHMATPWSFARLKDAFLEVFLTVSKPSRRPITAAKKKRKGEKGKAKKNVKNRKA